MARIAPEFPAEIAVLHPDPWTAPFWEAAREHRLAAPQCTSCGAFRMPPGPFCWSCRKQEVNWIELPGTGTVFTYTVTRKALIPQFKDLVPYVIAVIDLDGAPGARLVSNIIRTDPADVHVGMAVTVVWDDIHDRTTIPRFIAALH